jgi:hypothetical protein
MELRDLRDGLQIAAQLLGARTREVAREREVGGGFVDGVGTSALVDASLTLRREPTPEPPGPFTGDVERRPRDDLVPE